MCLSPPAKSGYHPPTRCPRQVRIKCKDYVKKIAVYKDKLAVQLPSKVVIYELANGQDEFDMRYQSATKITEKWVCPSCTSLWCPCTWAMRTLFDKFGWPAGLV